MQNGSHILRALIVDDEPPARRRLRKLLTPLIDEKRIHLVGEAEDGVDALEVLESEQVDLAFLDIQMPEMNGFDVLERLAPGNRPVIIFTTAFDSYALRAFEANAVDYLLKPISKDRLTEAVDRAHRTFRGTQRPLPGSDKLDRLLEWIGEEDERSGSADARHQHVRQLPVPYRDRILLIPIEQIISAEISEGITRVFAMDKDVSSPRTRLRQHVVTYTLDQLETMLPPDRFMRVHRSVIVNLAETQELIPWFSGRYKLILSGDHEVIASRERSKHLRDTLMI